jgi:hypothetical protein
LNKTQNLKGEIKRGTQQDFERKSTKISRKQKVESQECSVYESRMKVKATFNDTKKGCGQESTQETTLACLSHPAGCESILSMTKTLSYLMASLLPGTYVLFS